jgi:hypothetical protein
VATPLDPFANDRFSQKNSSPKKPLSPPPSTES